LGERSKAVPAQLCRAKLEEFMDALNSESRQWMAGEWLSGAALAPLAELNLQCLELTAQLALAGHGTPVQQSLGRRIAALSPGARAGLASTPYLLADAGFDNVGRWQRLADWRVEDLQRETAAGVFTAGPATGFVRGVLVYGWHLARAHRQLARVVLGMTPACARSVAELTLADLDWACQHRPGWVTLRWENRPQLWVPLLAAAAQGDRGTLQRASLRGIQLLGALALERRNG
jgi:hypothetical protein